MTVVAQLGIGARAKMQMAATGDRGFRLAAMLPRRRALKLHATGTSCTTATAPLTRPLMINPPGRR